MSVTRIWVFDPANNTDHEAFGQRGRPKATPERAGLGVP